jgi:hypothetical protein
MAGNLLWVTSLHPFETKDYWAKLIEEAMVISD